MKNRTASRGGTPRLLAVGRCVAEVTLCLDEDTGFHPVSATTRETEPWRVWVGSRVGTASSKGYFIRPALMPCALVPDANGHRALQLGREYDRPIIT